MRVDVGGREALCIVGVANWDKSCCGAGGCRYAMVPGYIINYKGETNEDGQAVSAVEIMSEQADRKVIEELVREAESVQQVNFW